MLATVRAASPIPSCGGQQQASNEWCKQYRTKEIAPESERPVSANEGNEQTQTEIEQIENHIPCRPPLAAFGASEGRDATISMDFIPTAVLPRTI
jgi:hypothetical protein